MRFRQPLHVQWSIVAVVALVAAALAAAGTALVLPGEPPASLASASASASIATSQRQHADSRSVELAIESGPTRALRAPASGVLTSFDAAIGSAIPDGTRIGTIDGRPVVALHTRTPLWRDLDRGDRGDDVRALQEALQRTGASGVVVDGVFGARTERAARRLIALDSSTDRVPFPATSIAWLPSATAVVRDCPTGVGSDVDRTSVLATFGPAIRSAHLSSTPVDPVPGSREVVFGPTAAPIGPDGRLDDADVLDRLLEHLEEQPEIDDSGPRTVTATWRLRDPVKVDIVPPTSIRVLAPGRACIGLPDGSTTTVDVFGSELGKTFVATADRKPLGRIASTMPEAARCR